MSLQKKEGKKPPIKARGELFFFVVLTGRYRSKLFVIAAGQNNAIDLECGAIIFSFVRFKNL